MAFTEKILTDEEVKAYLGIDVVDDMVRSNIALMKKAAADFLNSSVGKDVPDGDENVRAKMLALAAVADMYENRSYLDNSNKVSITVRKLVSDFSLQLILESRGE